MPTVKEYMVLSGDSESDLALTVNIYLNNGWQPLGGLASALSEEGKQVLLQAMVRWSS